MPEHTDIIESPFAFFPTPKKVVILESSYEHWGRTISEFLNSPDQEVIFLLEDPNVYTNFSFQNNLGNILQFSSLQKLLLKLLPDNFTLPDDLLKVSRDELTLTNIKLLEKTADNANIYCDMMPFYIGIKVVGFKFRFHESYREEALAFRNLIPKANELFGIMSVEAGANAFSFNIEQGKPIAVEDIIVMFLNTKQIENWEGSDQWVDIQQGLEKAELETIIVPEDHEALLAEIQLFIDKFVLKPSIMRDEKEVIINGFDSKGSKKIIKERIIIERTETGLKMSGCTIDITDGHDNFEYLRAMLKIVEKLTSLSDYGEQLELIATSAKEIVPDIRTTSLGKAVFVDGKLRFDFDLRRKYEEIQNFDVLNRRDELENDDIQRFAQIAHEIMQTAFETGKLNHINYKDGTQISKDLFETYGILDCISIPVIVKEKVIGVLNFSSTLPQAFTEEAIDKLTTLSRFLAIAIEKDNFLSTLRTEILNAISFAGKLAHDSRVPLATIITKAYLLGRHLAPLNLDNFEQYKTYLDSIEVQAKSISEMITDALLMYQFESEKREDYEEINFGKFKIELEDSAASLKATRKEKKHDIKIKFLIKEIDSNFTFYSKRKGLIRVMENLIGNSIKYAKKDIEGVVNIKISIEEDNLVIRVEDNGIGIPLEQRNRIFEEFFRAENGKESAEGTGVGLSSVKSFLDSIPGTTITFSDSELNGTEFVIEHPLHIEGVTTGFRLKDASVIVES